MESGIVRLVVVGEGVVKGTTIVQAHGQATRIKAMAGQKFILVDGGSGTGPENITVHREGKDLHVSLQGTPTNEAELVIADYYEGGGRDKDLVGLAEDGNYYTYVPADAQADHYVAMLGDWDTSAQVLGTGMATDLVGVAGLSSAVTASTAGLMSAGAFSAGSLAILGGFAAIGLAAVANGRTTNADRAAGGGGEGAQPVVDEIIDNVGLVTGTITSGGYTDDTTPTLNGHGTPGTQIQISDNGKPVGTVTVGTDGKWTYTPDPLGEGRHEIVAQPEGGGPSTSVVVIVDTIAPLPATSITLTDGAGTITGSITDNGRTDDRRPVLQGIAEPGSQVIIRDGDKIIGTVTVGTDGKWTYKPDGDLAEGDHALTTQVVDPASNLSPVTAPIHFTIDITPPPLAQNLKVIDHVGSITGPIGNNDIIDDAKPTFSGTAELGGKVVIRDNDQIVTTVSVGADGTWSYTPSGSMGEGAHALTAQVIDSVGNAGAITTAIKFTIDALPPAAPLIGGLVDHAGTSTGPVTPGTTIDDIRPTLSGTAEAGTTITIRDRGAFLGTTVAGSTGAWTFTPTTPLINGNHSLTAEATDSFGRTGTASTSFDFGVLVGGPSFAVAIVNVIDDVGPLTNISPGGLTNDNLPTVRGTAQVGSTVKLYDGTNLLGTSVADANGQWTITPTQPLGDGTHNLTAAATSATGVPSPTTGIYTIQVDATAPNPATGLVLTDKVGVTGTVAIGGSTDDASPTLSGSAEPGATISVYDGTKLLGTAVVTAAGTWSFTPPGELDKGAHALTVTVTDLAGNVSAPTTPALTFTVDTTNVTIEINKVADNVGIHTGGLQPGGVTDDARPVVSGLAVAGGLVKLYDETNTVRGTTTADSTGHWTITPTSDLVGQGTHSLRATVTTAAAGESAPTAVFTVVLDTLAPSIPVISGIRDDVGASKGTLGMGASTDDTTPTLFGTAEAGTTITVRDASGDLGTTVTDATGNWTFTPVSPLNPASFSFTAIATDPAGNSSQPSSPPWTSIVTPTPAAPQNIVLTDDFGNSTGPIGNGGSTDDATPTLSGTAPAGSTITVRDGSTFLGTTVTNSNGTWTFTPAAAIATGGHAYTAQVTDANGNVGVQSTAIGFTLLVVVPATPVISSLLDHVGTSTGPVTRNTTIDDIRPTLSGTADVGTIVTVRDRGGFLGTTTVSSTGAWSYTPTTPLLNGNHSLTAEATDIFGRTSSASTGFDFGVLTGGIASSVAIVTAAIGATITIRDNGGLLGTTVVDSSGNWSYTPAAFNNATSHSFTAQATTSSGLVGTESAAIAFSIDTSTPAAPQNLALTDDLLPGTGPIGNNGVTNDTTPTFSGTAAAGMLITVRDNGNFLGTTVTDSSGVWTYTPPYPTAAATGTSRRRSRASITRLPRRRPMPAA